MEVWNSSSDRTKVSDAQDESETLAPPIQYSNIWVKTQNERSSNMGQKGLSSPIWSATCRFLKQWNNLSDYTKVSASQTIIEEDGITKGDLQTPEWRHQFNHERSSIKGRNGGTTTEIYKLLSDHSNWTKLKHDSKRSCTTKEIYKYLSEYT